MEDSGECPACKRRVLPLSGLSLATAAFQHQATVKTEDKEDRGG